jgi:hypothetical protein
MRPNELSESEFIRRYPGPTTAQPLQPGQGWCVYSSPVSGEILYTYGPGAEIPYSTPPQSTGQGDELGTWCPPNGSRDPKIAQAGMTSPLRTYMDSRNDDLFTIPRSGKTTTVWPSGR